jgi:hypothetical protein
MKIDSWPQATVIISGVLATTGVVIFLVSAGWSGDAIGAFVTLALGLFAGQLANARKTATVDAKTDAQTDQLDLIQRQTNGLTAAERHAIAVDAAEHAIRKFTSP